MKDFIDIYNKICSYMVKKRRMLFVSFITGVSLITSFGKGVVLGLICVQLYVELAKDAA